jgi:hypothetical protein
MMKSWMALCLCAPLLLSSCGSSSGSRRKSLADMKMGERFSRSMNALKEGAGSTDPRYRSRYEKAMQSSLDDKGGASWLSRKKAHTTEFAGLKEFKAQEFKTQEYVESDRDSQFSSKTFGESGRTPSYADRTSGFAGRDSSFVEKQDRDALKVSRDSGAVFKTAPDRQALKSQQKNKGPQIIVLPEQEKGPAYTEDQVRSLLGRD